MKSIFLAILLMTASAANAAEINGINFDEKIKAGSNELVLNGVGICKAKQFGIAFKIYAGALYVPKPVKTFDEVLVAETKQVAIQFILGVDREKLNDAFVSKYAVECVEDCSNASKQFAQLRNVIPSMSKGDRMIFTSFKDKLIFEVTGSNAKKIEIADPIISKNAIAMFVNPKDPPWPELLDGLMGKKTD